MWKKKQNIITISLTSLYLHRQKSFPPSLPPWTTAPELPPTSDGYQNHWKGSHDSSLTGSSVGLTENNLQMLQISSPEPNLEPSDLPPQPSDETKTTEMDQS
ncbi:UDP-glycosyltransferase 75D1-like protein [Corchorus olitorius]|uniref:UDP-glycosyltransferase 75D1-like protein n=1 Tax=Corchorus olitorius TaxID=93759 RepID=A0A1R3KJU4_9ROSI|nr:UDP-glycosyltransferase 75D1-like protein [Corchorus olitorius]